MKGKLPAKKTLKKQEVTVVEMKEVKESEHDVSMKEVESEQVVDIFGSRPVSFIFKYEIRSSQIKFIYNT